MDDFELLFRNNYARLYYHALQLVHDKDGAEDLVQEAFTKLWRRRTDFDNEFAAKSFLYLTVRNAGLNVLRHEKVKERFAHHRSEEPFEESAALHKIIKAEALGEIYRSIEELPEGCRNVFKMGYLQELKNHEIAEQLNISVNTVKTQKARALQLLRLKLNPELFIIFFIFLSPGSWSHVF